MTQVLLVCTQGTSENTNLPAVITSVLGVITQLKPVNPEFKAW